MQKDTILQEVVASGRVASKIMLGTSIFNNTTAVTLILNLCLLFYAIWNNEMTIDRKGSVLMGTVMILAAIVFRSKAIRDNFEADLEEEYTKGTSIYNAEAIRRSRGTQEYQSGADVFFFLTLVLVFVGLFVMPLTFDFKVSMGSHIVNAGFAFMVLVRSIRDGNKATENLGRLNALAKNN